MSVLVLHHRGSLAGAPYDRWLDDYDGDVLLLASEQHLRLVGEELPAGSHGYRYLEAVPGYETGGAVEERALELARLHGLRHVVACQERDLERAAQLREILGLPGQTLDSVLPFRDKVLMKDAARAAGIPVAPYRAVECAVDLLAFADEHGFPLVLKPLDSAGSVDVRFLQSAGDLDAFLDGGFAPYGPHQPNLLVEAYVPGPMCHVDGLVVDGRVVFSWPSQYQFALADFRDDRGGRHDLTLDPDDPLTSRLLDLTDRTLDALPSPRHFAFHAEIFHTPDDRLVLCEIACRTGGAQNREVSRTLFGLDPTECWIRAQLGLPLPVEPGRGRLEPMSMAGQLSLGKRAGTVMAVPGPPPFPWVRTARVFVRPGEAMAEPRYSSDLMASFVVAGPDQRTCRERLERLEAWFLDGLVVGETTPAAAGDPPPRRPLPPPSPHPLSPQPGSEHDDPQPAVADGLPPRDRLVGR